MNMSKSSKEISGSNDDSYDILMDKTQRHCGYGACGSCLRILEITIRSRHDVVAGLSTRRHQKYARPHMGLPFQYYG